MLTALFIPVIIAAVVVIAVLVGDGRSSCRSAHQEEDFWNGI